ncbi:MAG: 1-acyl-sn-glycerol-3-phosphate acyltransferase [Planctomycetes bacterium]|nr:1-acyl-sn-glycerol-3-phosphate acyltransferase [Planctomycetota bacterium]MCB9905999.1 1-acyl-sn-glycerol-3-phosphate acyltransferase [Planctomycetota bacterium]
MSGLRAFWRLLGLCTLTLPAYCLYLLQGLVGGRGRRGLRRAWARCVARLLGERIEVSGKPPAAPFVLVANHLSYLDILTLMSELDCVFVAKSEIAGWPVLGLLARTTGTIFVERTRKSQLPEVLDSVARALEGGSGVVFFPEGTSSRGATVLPFKTSLFEVALRAGLPVHTASLHYEVPSGATPAWLSVAWWGDMTFADHFLRLLTLPRIRARIAFGPVAIDGADRKTLADRTHRAVAGAFEPLVECEAS